MKKLTVWAMALLLLAAIPVLAAPQFVVTNAASIANTEMVTLIDVPGSVMDFAIGLSVNGTVDSPNFTNANVIADFNFNADANSAIADSPPANGVMSAIFAIDSSAIGISVPAADLQGRPFTDAIITDFTDTIVTSATIAAADSPPDNNSVFEIADFNPAAGATLRAIVARQLGGRDDAVCQASAAANFVPHADALPANFAINSDVIADSIFDTRTDADDSPPLSAAAIVAFQMQVVTADADSPPLRTAAIVAFKMPPLQYRPTSS